VVSRLTVHYANDSTDIDSIEGPDFTWATFPITEFTSQKINLFEHDYTGTPIESIIDQEDTPTPFVYVQGMNGVNTKIRFTAMEEWLEGGKVAINSAKLIFDVVPEEQGGIPVDELAEDLLLYIQTEEDVLDFVYDYEVLRNSNPNGFTRGLERVSKGMFQDTTYVYQFNIPLQFQAMADGVTFDYEFRLRNANSRNDYKISQLWSNLSTNPRRIRVEVVYLKL
jgi:hypothetical protein